MGRNKLPKSQNASLMVLKTFVDFFISLIPLILLPSYEEMELPLHG